jgi:oxalate decarboxylase
MFGSHGRFRTETLDPGDVGFIPQGYGHSIENVGNSPARLLIAFNTGTYAAIGLSQWIAGNPAYLLADHFGKPVEFFNRFPQRDVFIAPSSPAIKKP